MPQVWPALDDFAHGSPVYGTNVIGYLGLVAGSGMQTGRLHNGYGAGTASARSTNQADTTGSPVGAIRRQAFPADVRVRSVSRKQAVSGVADVSSLKRHAVFARLTAGTLTGDGTDVVRLTNCTCYAFTAEWIQGVQALRFSLIRFVAGAATVLASEDDTAGAAGNFLSDTELVLEVTDDGSGNAQLKGYVTGVALGASLATVVYQPGGHGHKVVSTPGAPKPGVPLLPLSGPGAAPRSTQSEAVLTVSFTDSSGSKITAGGRCGFCIDPERVVTLPSPANVVAIASLFEVADISVPASPAVLWRDEFQRAAPNYMQQMTNRFGTVGRNLASDYACDQASIVTSNFLKRSTADQSAESPITIDDGQAADLDGVDDYLEVSAPIMTYAPPPVVPSQLEVTIAVWARIDDNRDGNEFYDAYENLVSPHDGFGFGWRTGSAGNFLLQARFGGGVGGELGTVTLDSPERAEGSHLLQPWLYAMTYKANANPSTGEGRVRFYVGRVGVATMLGEVAVPAGYRPTWLLDEAHVLGQRVGFFGGTPDENFLSGALDDVHVFYKELTAAQVALVANPLTDPVGAFPAMGLAAGWHLDAFTLVTGQNRSAPWFASASTGIPVNTIDWMRLFGAAVIGAGLVPVSTGATFVALAQRAADSPVDQHRAISFRPASETSIGGVIVRGAPGATPTAWSGYRLHVAAGNPAPISLYRVVNGVPTKLAEQDQALGTVAVTSGDYADVSLQVRQQPTGGPGGPVMLTAFVDGDVVPMASVSPSVLVDLDGNVLDIGDARILSGPLEGFWGVVDGLQNRFDDFDLGEVSGAPPSDDVGGYALPAESDGAFGDLGDVLVPDWAVERRVPAPRAELEFESGHRQRLVLDSYERRYFPFHKVGLTKAEFEDLQAFFDDHDGGAIPFQWDPSFFLPEEQAGYWRFLEGTWRDGWAGNQRTLSFELEEVRAPSPS